MASPVVRTASLSIEYIDLTPFFLIFDDLLRFNLKQVVCQHITGRQVACNSLISLFAGFSSLGDKTRRMLDSMKSFHN